MGSVLAQIIPVLITPFITRIYSPSDFGRFIFYTASVTLLSLISTGNYEASILLPRNRRKSFDLTVISMFVSSFSSFILVFCLIVTCEYFEIKMINENGITTYLILYLGIISYVSVNVYSIWLNKVENYSALNVLKLLQQILIAIATILLGLAGITDGLIYGLVIGNVLIMTFVLSKLLVRIKIISKHKVLNAIKEYRIYPLWVMPSVVLNNLASSLPVATIKQQFSDSINGVYSVTTRVLNAPSAVISTSVSQIFYRELAELKEQSSQIILQSLFKVFALLAGGCALIFIPLYIYSEDVFVAYYGPQWQEAGTFARILIPSAAIRFIVSPLSVLFHITYRQKILSIWQLSYFISTILLIVFANYENAIHFINLIVLNDLILYSAYFLLILFAAIYPIKNNE